MSFTVGFVGFAIEWWIVAIFTACAALASLWPPLALVSAAYLVLLAHELGHAIAIWKIAKAPSTVFLFRLYRGSTISMRLTRHVSAGEWIGFHLAGPLAGIGAGLVVVAITVAVGGAWWHAAAASAIVTTHLINLTPLRPFSDGWWIRAYRRSMKERAT